MSLGGEFKLNGLERRACFGGAPVSLARILRETALDDGAKAA